MCGIIGTFNFGDNKTLANEKAVEIMQDQINRGSNGFGAIFIEDNFSFKIKRATEITKILVDCNLNPSRMIILHHRQPTSSENKISQTHPIEVEHKNLKHGYLVIHNGIIRNHKELKEEHEKEGIKYATEGKENKEQYNDSESFAIELTKFIEKQTGKINALGSYAFIALQYNKKTQKAEKIYYGRNSSSNLKMAKSRNILRLSSEGQGDEVKEDTLYCFNLTDFNIKKEKMEQATQKTDPVVTSIIDYGQKTPIGFKPNNDYHDYRPASTDTDAFTEMDMAEIMEENKTAIIEKLDALYEEMEESEKIWKIDIDEKLKDIVKAIMVETTSAYKTAIDFYSQKIAELYNEKEKEKDKLPLSDYDYNDIPGKYYNR